MAPRTLIRLAIAAAIAICLFILADHKLLPLRIAQLKLLEYRVKEWDWKDTPEETFCRNAPTHQLSKDPIPSTVHFVLIAREGQEYDLDYAQFLAIKAAVLRMNASEIKVHAFGLNAQNIWWKSLAPHVKLIDIELDELYTPFGPSQRTWKIEHQADIRRMEIIMREGGIYLDTDVYTLKPFTDLLNNPRDTILGHEGGNRFGLCNAVIVSRPGSSFMKKWMESYESFNPSGWNEHSVMMPKKLQVLYPDLICPLSPSVFFWPTWALEHVAYMHELITPEDMVELQGNITAFGGAMYENQLAFHAVAAKDYLTKLTPESVQEVDTRFNILVRDITSAPL